MRLIVSADNQELFAVSLPSSGLLIGGEDRADLTLPGAAEAMRLIPARQEVWLEYADGRTGRLSLGESLALGRFTLRVEREAGNVVPKSRVHPLTKTLIYHVEKHELRTITRALQVVEGPDAPREIELERREYIIGQLAGCDIVLIDPYVSGRHARLFPIGNGWKIADLDSRNGVELEGKRVTEAYWPAGDSVRLGQTRLKMASVQQVDAVTPDESTNFAGMVGNSEAMRRVFALIRRVADSDANVLITGPTGSGKELVARALHAFGSRPNAIFLPFNCGAVVPSLAASELFGHARGAFTGASEKRQGAFEVANGGTLFLDEIGELPLEVQPHLLRVLEQNEICRVGENRPIPVDVRIIAATLRDLEAEVAAGRFREDLLYRINLVPIDLPPLNERLEDVPLLVEHFLAREAARQGREQPLQISPEAVAALTAHSWPGNVRELANVIRRAVVLAGPDRPIKPTDLMLAIGAAKQTGAGRLPTLALAERELIGRALARYPSRRAAAEALDIAASTLYEKIKKYGLDEGE